MSAALLWFRDDLRVEDNPALAAAARHAEGLACVYVLDEGEACGRKLGGAARWWLHHALQALDEALRARGSRLILAHGDPTEIIPRLAGKAKVATVYWNRRYGPSHRARDQRVADGLAKAGIGVETFNGHLLFAPEAVRSKSGQPFRRFTPFWRAVTAKGEPRTLHRAPKRLPPAPALLSDLLSAWDLLPERPDWATHFGATWAPGAPGGRRALSRFVDHHLRAYSTMRNRADLDETSRLSPHLRFGEISPVAIWHAVTHAQASGESPPREAEAFLTELGWREFSYHLLDSAEDLARTNIQRRFDGFAWLTDPKALRSWQKGRTGYPFVDAGMRQLWQTGFMHNRVRMVAASFLIKHLLIDWRIGEAWFWDTLVDADPANNPANWQWVAGSGADAAPYFRIFNPISQGKRFDPKGDYVRRYVPELKELPARYIHAPFAAPAPILREAGIVLGDTYPHPIVGHEEARKRALAAFRDLPRAGRE